MTGANGGLCLELMGASKDFFGVRVLHDVDLDIEPGEIHALLGQNGSGKSTLIKILSGFHAPDGDTSLRVLGREVHLPMSDDPSHHGMAFVHQNLGLAMDMSVLDNLAFGDYTRANRLRIDWKAQRSLAQEQLEEFGVRLDPDIDLGASSSAAERALIAIARAVTRIRQRRGGGVLILDEPTVYLPANDVRHLQSVVRGLADSGVGVLYVTHRLDELRGFARRATVLRDGFKVGEVVIDDTEKAELIEMITGSRLEEGPRSLGHVRAGATVLEVRDLRTSGIPGLSFEVSEGEILGLTGLVGMGQDEVLAAIFGATEVKSGTILLYGREVTFTPRGAIENGVAFLPADRARHSGAMTEAVSDNISLPVLGSLFFSRGKIDTGSERRHVGALMDALDVRPRKPSELLERFSGGNQQKALLAKWLQIEPVVLMLEEPVQGVDVGAKAQIFSQLRTLAQGGSAIVVASSEYEDLASLCDRVLIMTDGRISEILSGEAVTKERIAAACFGGWTS